MAQLLTAAQMRTIEQTEIESGRVTGLELMERAGKGVLEAVLEEWPDLAKAPHRAVVLCGPGNNGGDGFVVARLLKDRGWEVSVRAVGVGATPQGSAGDAWANAKRWRALGGELLPFEDFGHELCREGHILIVDALFGIGQNRSADPILKHWWASWDEMANMSPGNDVHTVSIDVPTGYDTDTGDLLGERPFEADLTVTFHKMKPVHEVLRSQGCKVVVVDIGL